MTPQPRVIGGGQRRGAIAALGVVACLWLAPAESRAACGSHVTYPGDRATTHEPPDPARPCHGPSCSQAPARAPLVPPSLPTSQLDRDPALAPAVHVESDPCSRLLARADKVRAVHRAFPPEPPPRATDA